MGLADRQEEAQSQAVSSGHRESRAPKEDVTPSLLLTSTWREKKTGKGSAGKFVHMTRACSWRRDGWDAFYPEPAFSMQEISLASRITSCCVCSCMPVARTCPGIAETERAIATGLGSERRS